MDSCFVSVDPYRRSTERQLMAVEQAARAEYLYGFFHEVTEIKRSPAEAHLRARHTARVDEVVDQVCQSHDLPINYGSRARNVIGRTFREIEYSDGTRQRAQGIAKLMAQHRQELVLRTVG